MPVYDKPVRILMRDMVGDLDLQKGQVLSRSQVNSWFQANYPKIKSGTISGHLIRLSTNARSRVHHSLKPDEDDLFYQIDSSHFRLYQPKEDPAPIYKSSSPPPEAEDVDIDELSTDGEFAYESDLRDFLARNLSLLETGLHLYEDEGVTGVEFPVGTRFIDILAVDADDNYVVIELKVSRAYDRVVGQLLRYMGWIVKNQSESTQQVRGMIVARDISQDLLLACSLVPNVDLFEYQLSVSVNRIPG